ncbi:hypothetical protein DDI74_00590 [Chryseobacterium gleum]|uniref:hypothetical protein n=1 Tax=Chryseobacterium gleum TaxID=250 RepID=UPI00103CCD78|nr:hypothetical protein [Chryseobacterium gleum]QBJ84849.1 hypothetical protein DDI74_00590 [Chryseobacterium gleum]
MKGYTITENCEVEPHIRFLRIDPTDLKLTLKNILDSLMNLSWINNFDKDYIKSSYEEKAIPTINYITDNIIKENDDSVTSSSGEYIVSELARLAVVEKFSYLDIPLAELFKIKEIGNHGFDFYSSNKLKNILFGEAKYLARQNAYGSALKQIYDFYGVKRHIMDITDIQNFFCDESLENCNKDEIGFIAAFSSKAVTTELLIKNIEKNSDYLSLKKFKEIILVAVNL